MKQRGRVWGRRDPGETWWRMKRARDACLDAGLEPPRELEEFFGKEEPCVWVDITDATTFNMGVYEVDLNGVPRDVRWVRFRAKPE